MLLQIFKPKLPKVVRAQLERAQLDRAVSGSPPSDWQGLLNLVNDQEFRLSMLSAKEKQELFPALYGSVAKSVV